MTKSKELARAIGLDAGNRSMKRGNRTAWNDEDFQAATDAYVKAQPRWEDTIDPVTYNKFYSLDWDPE